MYIERFYIIIIKVNKLNIMNIVMNIDDLKNEHIFFCPPVKNTIIKDGRFSKMIYSNSLISLNSVYIQIPIRFLYVERYFNKIKYSFDIKDFHNREIVEKLCALENTILEKINSDKKPVLHLFNKLSRGVIIMDIERDYHLNAQQDICLILKISGVWETKYNYGLTFKII